MKRLTSISLMLLTASLLTMVSVNAEAKYCGKVQGNKIKTNNKLSCSEAKRVYTDFLAGKTPEGWTCGQSVGGCGNGKKEFSFK